MQRNNVRSIAYLTVVGSDPVEEIEAAAAAGLDAVGLRLVAPLGLDLAHPVIRDRGRIASIRQALDRTGIRVLDTEVVTLTADTRVAEMRPLLDASAELGASFLQITSEDPDRSRAMANFAQVCDQAMPLGLKLAFEFMQWRSVKTVEQAAAFVVEAGAPNGGIVLDTLHLSRSGGSPGAVAGIPRDRIFFLQLCDAAECRPATDADLIAEARGGRLYPGEGSLWLEDLFGLLPDDIAISIEVPPGPDADRNTLREAEVAARKLDGWLERVRAGHHGTSD